MKINKNTFILILIILSIGMGFVEVSLNLREEFVTESTQSLWAITFLLFTIFWAYYDAKQSKTERPFDFGLLIYMFWPIAFPWYLISTRGIEGIMILFSFITLWYGPWIAGLVAYSYYL